MELCEKFEIYEKGRSLSQRAAFSDINFDINCLVFYSFF